MGAISFSIDRTCAELLVRELALTTFVETGTFHGTSVASMVSVVKRVFSIEIDSHLAQVAATRFASNPNISILQGSSPALIKTLLQTGRIPFDGVLWWLDAHWCKSAGTDPSGQCPLLEELAAIGMIGSSSVIAIDDARLFFAPPSDVHAVSNWPDFEDILAGLRNAAPRHRILIVNDVIWVVPVAGFAVLRQYAARHGVDWLAIAEKARTYDALKSQLVEKDNEIVALSQENKKRLELIGQLNETLEEISAERQTIFLELRAWRFTGFPFWPLQRLILSLIKKKKALTKIRLGTLRQHPPRSYSFYVGSMPKGRKPEPTISVVTPSYNQGSFLSQTIQSVLFQRYPKLQYVVQDGGSKDQSADLIREHAGSLHAWESAPDRGQAHAINLGFQKTSGEIMAWLNADDLYTPSALWRVAQFFQNNPQVDVVYGHRLIIDEKGHMIGTWIMPQHDNEILSWADYVPQETLFWRRRIWQKIGSEVNEYFQFALDWDLLLRFRKAGAKIVRIPALLGCFRVHDAQKTSRELGARGKAEMEIIRRRIHGRDISDQEIFAATKKYLRASIYSNAAWQMSSRVRKIFTLKTRHNHSLKY